MSELRELQHGVGTDLVRALLDKLDTDEWVQRYAVVLLDAVDERDKRIKKLEHELEETRKVLQYELNEVQCADEAIADLETERNRLCEAIIEEYKIKGAFEKVYDMATEILGDD